MDVNRNKNLNGQKTLEFILEGNIQEGEGEDDGALSSRQNPGQPLKDNHLKSDLEHFQRLDDCALHAWSTVARPLRKQHAAPSGAAMG